MQLQNINSNVKIKKGDRWWFNGRDQHGQVKDLSNFKGVKIFSTFPRLNTTICDEQTMKIAALAKRYPKINFISITSDRVHTISQWCLAHNIDNVTILSSRKRSGFTKKFKLRYPFFKVFKRGLIVVNEQNKVVDFDFKRKVSKLPNFEMLDQYLTTTKPKSKSKS